MPKFLFTLLFFALLSGCGEEAAITWLKEQKYSNIEMTGLAFTPMRGPYNGRHNHFTATNPQNQKVTGIVCTGTVTYAIFSNIV